jgi:hypothetical protein
MLKFGTQIARLPKVCGKACVELVGSLWAGSGQKSGQLHIHNLASNALWITRDFTSSLYTICIQVIPCTVGKFTPVVSDFYTLYTPLTTTTTTYINTIRRNT